MSGLCLSASCSCIPLCRYSALPGPGVGKSTVIRPMACAYSGRLHFARGGVRKKIHIVEAGGAGFQHFGDGEFAAVVHELRADPFRFRRPHVVLQPVHQRQVVGHAAKQTHGRVRRALTRPGINACSGRSMVSFN